MDIRSSNLPSELKDLKDDTIKLVGDNTFHLKLELNPRMSIVTLSCDQGPDYWQWCFVGGDLFAEVLVDNDIPYEWNGISPLFGVASEDTIKLRTEAAIHNILSYLL